MVNTDLTVLTFNRNRFAFAVSTTTSTTIYPAVHCNKQTPEDVRYSCNGGLDNHDNHQNNARHEEKYHLLDNESCFGTRMKLHYIKVVNTEPHVKKQRKKESIFF